MKEIILKQLILKNFKGIKNLNINFEKESEIYGANATGKTSIFDAFTWLLFDKDSNDRAQFEVKTLDENNNPIHGLDHSVEALLDVDGKEVLLRKVYKENWNKKRGEAEKLLTGHTTDYFINDVGVKKKDFNDKINEIIEETLFKLISNPIYFNDKIHWKDRRKLIMSIVGEVSKDEILSDEKFNLITKLLEDKEVDEAKKIIQAKKKKINDELNDIPVRIDETNSMIENKHNFPELEAELNVKQKELEETEIKILDESERIKEISDIKTSKYKKETELKLLQEQQKYEIYKPKTELENKLSKFEREVKSVKEDVSYIQSEQNKIRTRKNEIKNQIGIKMDQAIEIQKKNTELRKEWTEENSKTLELPHELVCPLCGQNLPEDKKHEKIEEMQNNFNLQKETRLKQITQRGLENKTAIENIYKTVDELDLEKKKYEEKLLDNEAMESEKITKMNALFIEINNLKTQIENFKPKIEESEKEIELKYEIDVLNSSIKQLSDNTVEDLKNKKNELIKIIDSIKAKLATRSIIEKAQLRIDELKVYERKLSDTLANLEGQEYLCDEFIKTKVNMLEGKINKKFKTVKFKMFNTLVNGGIEECCETLINGVPFNDANNAAKVNSGIDIINVLTQYYQVCAPIFIDNRESINDLTDTESQVISLIVSREDKELRIKNNMLEVA